MNEIDAGRIGCGHEDDFAQLRVIVLVEDNALYLLFGLLTHVPSVVLGIDGQRRVVVQVVEFTVVAVVFKHVATRIVVLTLFQAS